MRIILSLVCCSLLFSCARAPLMKRDQAMRKVSPDDVPQWKEDLSIDSLLLAIKRQIVFFRKSKRTKPFQFGNQIISQKDYLRSLEYFTRLLGNHINDKRIIPNKEMLWKELHRYFDFYEVYGRDSWGEVFITSYYEPIIRGSRRRRGNHTQPLYRLPKDLVEIKIEEWEKLMSNMPDTVDIPSVLRGRIIRSKGLIPSVVPYYSREEIDSLGMLRNKRLELCWIDPLDAFILQIQGSGVITLGKKRRLRVGYAGQNGHPYEAVGRFLTDVIPKEDITLHTIEGYLRSIPKKDMLSFFNKNPSYVFFKKMRQKAVTYLGVPATAGRTIATDPRFFSKGALAFLSFKKPIFQNSNDMTPLGWLPVSRFVVDQDVGGAIRGGGRLDLFWGSGDKAKKSAGVMKEYGKLFYVVPNKDLLNSLRQEPKRIGKNSL